VINARKDVEIARSRLIQAGAYSNPYLNFQVAGLADYAANIDDSHELTISQELELSGKRGKRREIAGGMISVAGEQLRSVSLDVALEVKERYHELLLVRKRSEIAVENLNLVRRLLDSVQVKYQSGSIYLNELLRAKIELSQAENELVLTDKEMKVARSRLNLLLGKAVSDEYRIEETLNYQEKKIDYETVKSRALSRNPDYRSAVLMAGLSKTGVELARREAYPNPAFGLIFSKENHVSRPLGASIGFSVPLWYGNSGGIRERELELEKNRNDVDYFGKQLELDVYDTFIEAESAAKQVETLRINVNEAVEIQSLIDLQYREGKADFLVYLDSLKTVRNVKLGYYEAITRYNNKYARMERVAGGEIE